MFALGVSAAFGAEHKAQVQGVSDRALATAIERAIGDESEPPANRLDARRRATSAAESAEALLRSEGYYDADIVPDVGEGEKPAAILRITPGPRTLLTAPAIDWLGAPPPVDVQDKALKALALNTQTPARSADVIAAEGRAVSAVEQAGYADASVEPREVVVDHATHTMQPTYRIKTGDLVRLGDLRLPNPGRTRGAYLRSLTPWKVGDVYAPRRVAELERRLQETQAFDTATVSLAPLADIQDGLRPVIVTLKDRAGSSLDFSAGYSTTEGADFDVRYSMFNILRRADTITLEARLAEVDSRFGGEISLPNFHRPARTLKTSTYLFRTVTDAYTEAGYLAASELTQRFGPTSFVSLGASITASEVDDKELGKSDYVTLRTIGGFLLDRSDNSLNPTKGFKLDARAVPTVALGDKDQVYLRLTSQVSGYLPFGKGASTVLAGRLRIGSLVGGSIPAVPAQDRFFAGGGGSVRGYEFQGVGPRYPNGPPVGGLSLVEASVELRQKIRGPLGVVAFLDTGSVGESPTPDFRHVSPGIGFGVRYDLGFAPVRIDIAAPLKKSAVTGAAPFQLYLSIGQAF
jgi:translocation and assembly module TamA